jgi:HAE1 family hydrophobic/amphiphilic exporter-1
LGSVILGGLLVSTVFTLFLVPMLFSLSFEMRDRILKRPLASNAPIETPSEPEMVSAS